MRIMALDIGDRWIGVALSDALKITSTPLTTVERTNLFAYLTTALTHHRPETMVVGYPKTMKGTESEQTKKVTALFEQLRQEFDSVAWTLWDERLSSKRAKLTTQGKDPHKEHAVAASFILQTYLDYLHYQSP